MTDEKKGRRRLGGRVREFFYPPASAPRWRRWLPYAALGVLTFILLTAGAYGWEYTNSPVFCGTTCHTMPPEFAAYQVSPHARVACVECHIGESFIATRITRKAGDLNHVINTVFTNYEFPIYAGKLRPARETCEMCHYPAKFSDDSLRQIVHFQPDEDNTETTTYLAMRTGGGTEREGLGRGIHWHVENEVWFVATDERQQEIPYVRVVENDGSEIEYVSLTSGGSAEDYRGMEAERMDCMTCHNRISHLIRPPDQAVDMAINRNQIDSDIPYIRAETVALLDAEYQTDDEARTALATLDEIYAEKYPDVYAEYEAGINEAEEMILAIYDDTVFRSQEVDWDTHPNNVGHNDWPGCFRCHDGEHLNAEDEAIRLECNLCHSIPQVVEPGVIEPELPLATGIQPESHFSTHWIALHYRSFDQTCQACHTVEDAGGTSNTSFCSNSGCHGRAWEYAELDAPELADTLAAERAEIQANMPPPTPTPDPDAVQNIPSDDPQPTQPPAAPAGEDEPEGEATPVPADVPLTWNDSVGAILAENCVSCHSEAIATGTLVLETYEGAMTGAADGPVILPGDPDGSRLVEVQRGGHFATLDDDVLEVVIEWIRIGAPEE